jgi:hypothetical protein
MKCPKCKKPSELQTKRTLANGREVTRERYCSKCRNRFITIERLDTDIAEHDSQYERKIGELGSNNQALKAKIEEYREVFIGFRNVMEYAAAERKG